MLAASFVALSALVVAYAAVRLRRAERGTTAVSAAAKRHAAHTREVEAFSRRRQTAAEMSATAEAAVGLGTTVTQTSHHVIAAIPFTVLEAIPSTSQGAKAVREVHDRTADTVYGLIGVANKTLGSGLRRRLVGQPVNDQSNQ